MSEKEFETYFAQFRNKRIMLIGDAIIDHYIYGNVTKISPDAPVPLMDVQREEVRLGSIATTIQYILKLGGDVELVTSVGKDYEGEHFLKLIREFNLGMKGVFQFGTTTPKITRILSQSQQSQQILRMEKRYTIDQTEMQQLNIAMEKFIEERIERCDMILILDYNLGLLNPILLSQVLAIAKKYNKLVVARPESQTYYYYKNIYLIAMNRNIASAATGVNPINETSMRIMGTKLLNESRSIGIFIPYVETESYFYQNEEVVMLPNLLRHRAISYTNVGAATSAVLCLMTAVGAPINRIVEAGHYAGSLAAMKEKGEYFGIAELIAAIKEVHISGKISCE